MNFGNRGLMSIISSNVISVMIPLVVRIWLKQTLGMLEVQGWSSGLNQFRTKVTPPGFASFSVD